MLGSSSGEREAFERHLADHFKSTGRDNHLGRWSDKHDGRW